MLVAMSMAKLHLLAEDYQNEVQHDFFDHVMPLALVLALHTANGTTVSLTSRQLK